MTWSVALAAVLLSAQVEAQRELADGAALAKAGKTAEAIAANERAMALDEGLLPARYALATMQTEIGRERQAIHTLCELFAYIRNARAYKRLEMPAEEIVALAAKVEHDPRLAALRGTTRFESVRACAVTTVDAAGGMIAALDAATGPHVCAPDPSTGEGTEGRCATKADGGCPIGFVRVKRVAAILAAESCEFQMHDHVEI